MIFGSLVADKILDQFGPLTVYAAQDQTTGQKVSLTVFAPAPTTDHESALRAQWLERLKHLRAMQHPAIQGFTGGKRTAEGQLYVVSAYAPPPLWDAPLDRAAALAMIAQLSGALDYAHEQGIAHGALLRNVAVINGQYILRGFETCLEKATAEAVSTDIAMLAKLIHRAISGPREHRVSLSPAVTGILARALRGEFATAGSLFDALNHPRIWRDPEALRLRLALMVGLSMAAVAIIGIIVLMLSRQPVRSADKATLPELAQIITVTATNTSLPTLTATASSTATSTATNLTPTSIASAPPLVPTQTYTPTLTPTLTPTATPTSTPTSTLTAISTEVSTPTSSVAATSVPSPTPTPTLFPTLTLTNTPLPAAARTMPCLALVGDSVTHGGLTYEVPEVGYIVALGHPLAEYVGRRLNERGLNALKAVDRGVSHTGISSLNHPSYYQTSTYAELRKDHCRFYAIMPWLNDISPEIPMAQAAVRHVESLAAMIGVLLRDNPYGRIILFNYYHGATAPFALRTWASGFIPENVIIYNNELEKACKYGPFAQYPQVYCAETNQAFDGMGITHVIGPTTRQDLIAGLVEPLTEKQTEWLDYYFGKYPDGLLQGDGVHLSVPGKTALAAYRVKLVETLPPVELLSDVQPSATP